MILINIQMQKLSTIVILSIGVFFSLFSFSYGASYYVDNAANGTNNGTSWVNAWKSFKNINWSSISAGDTIYISGGSSSKLYYETLNIGSSTGTNISPITITKGKEKEHNGNVIIDGNDLRSNGIISTSSGRNYFTISNLTVRNHRSNEIRIENSIGTIIKNIIIPDSECKGVRFRYNTNCTISGIHYDSVDSGASSTTDGIFIQDSKNTTIEDNYIEITNEDGVSHDDCFQQGSGTSWAGGGTFRGNYCNQNNRDTVNSQGFFWEDAKGTWNIYNNIVVGHEYVKNLINFKNARSGTVLNIYNNTIIGGSKQNGNIVRIQAADAVILNMKNNIVYSTSSNYSVVNLSGSMTENIDYNIWYCPNYTNCHDGFSWLSWQSKGYDRHGYNTNPRLNKEYKIDDTSAPGHNRGTTIDFFSYDKDGVRRPQGSGWDIGAYEFGEGAGNNQPLPPRNLRQVRGD